MNYDNRTRSLLTVKIRKSTLLNFRENNALSYPQQQFFSAIQIALRRKIRKLSLLKNM